MDDWAKFRETILPPKEAFYSKLAIAGVNEEDYEHAQIFLKLLGKSV